MFPPDLLSFVDPFAVVGLSVVGVIFGWTVLWHFPNAQVAGAWLTFCALAVADVLPWVVIISNRAYQHLQDAAQFPGWYLSIGTMLMFLAFDATTALGIRFRTLWVIRAKRKAAVLPHGYHHPRRRHL